MHTRLVIIFTQRLTTKSLKWSGHGLTWFLQPYARTPHPHFPPILISHYSCLTYIQKYVA